ncbi:unnamed protein product, partial [marine sediment metagenome]
SGIPNPSQKLPCWRAKSEFGLKKRTLGIYLPQLWNRISELFGGIEDVFLSYNGLSFHLNDEI